MTKRTQPATCFRCQSISDQINITYPSCTPGRADCVWVVSIFLFLFPHPVLHVAAIHENILAENNLAYTRYKFYGQRGLRCLLMLVINCWSYADSCLLIKVQRCGVPRVGAGGRSCFGQKHLKQVIPTYTISRPGAFDGATAHFFQLRHP